MNPDPAARQAFGYLQLVVAATVLVAVLLPASPAAPVVTMFVPVGTVLALSLVWGRSVWHGIGLNRPGLRYWPAALAIPAAVAAIALGAAVLVGAARPLSVTLADVGSMGLSLVITTGLVLGEEIGWRGFLLPRIQRFTSRPRAALVTGFAHALIHLPLVLLTVTYNREGSRWVIAPVMVVTITAAGVCYGWLRDASRSIWPVALAHAAGNTAMATIAEGAIPGAPIAFAYVAGEGGLVIAAVFAVAAILVATLARLNVWRPTSTQSGASFVEHTLTPGQEAKTWLN